MLDLMKHQDGGLASLLNSMFKVGKLSLEAFEYKLACIEYVDYKSPYIFIISLSTPEQNKVKTNTNINDLLTGEQRWPQTVLSAV